MSRHLSSAQTKAALKPFYFAVHPDLFGQYPMQRVREIIQQHLTLKVNLLQNFLEYLKWLMTKGFKLKGNPMFSKGERKLCCHGKYHKVRLFCYHTLGQIQDFM